MKRTLFTSLALATAAIIPLTLATAGSGGQAAAPLQECGTSSATTFTHTHTVSASGGSCTDAAFKAYDEMIAELVANSGVVCGPCELSTGCEAVAQNLSPAMRTVYGPTETTPGHWEVKVEFNGKYDVLCTKCAK